MISVIIPCYNCADTISECIYSMLVFEEVAQIICVINGCTDTTEEIVRGLALREDRMTIIAIQEKGPGVARNAGVAYVQQPYTFFMDADDYVHEDSFRIVLATLKANLEADFISFNHTYQKNQLGSGTGGVQTFSEFKEYYEACNAMFVIPKNVRIVKSSLVKRPDVYYAVELLVSEDVYFLQLLMVHARQFIHQDISCYYYREDDNGLGVVKNNSGELLLKKLKGLQWVQKNRVKDRRVSWYNKFFLKQYLEFVLKLHNRNRNLGQTVSYFLFSFRPYGINPLVHVGYQFRFLLRLSSTKRAKQV